ncbi:unnamed protein product [Phytophthora fragariaefolia]|uniref:Unnamed protein product n=1 Tax=Phytophthora fragariaefolia TaxID=1490495 RepID=A0A9W6XLB9_9STRA|nr:unnamed protein product [Phytophthora fragariaefolia]
MCQTYKVIVVGDGDAGKTSLLRRMVDRESLSAIDSAPNDYLSKMAIVEGASPIKVQLWDTADQEKFGVARLPNSYFRHANAAIIVYDVTNRLSFGAVLRWVMQVLAYRSTAADSLFSIVLVGTKADVAGGYRQVFEEEGRAISRVIGASSFYECSSKDGTNIHDTFNAIATSLVRGTSWSLSSVDHLGFAPTDLKLSTALAATQQGKYRLAAPSGGLDVASPIPTTLPIAARSPTLKVLSAEFASPVLGTSYLGTLAALLSMPMVLLWLDDEAVLQWAEALGM